MRLSIVRIKTNQLNYVVPQHGVPRWFKSRYILMLLIAADKAIDANRTGVLLRIFTPLYSE